MQIHPTAPVVALNHYRHHHHAAEPLLGSTEQGVAMMLRYDGYQMLVGHVGGNLGGAVLPVTRKIEYKAFPSRHECNAKCLNGRHNGTCECKCGGANHGRGMFTKFLKAA